MSIRTKPMRWRRIRASLVRTAWRFWTGRRVPVKTTARGGVDPCPVKGGGPARIRGEVRSRDRSHRTRGKPVLGQRGEKGVWEAIQSGQWQMPGGRSQMEDARVTAGHCRRLALGEWDALLRALDVASGLGELMPGPGQGFGLGQDLRVPYVGRHLPGIGQRHGYADRPVPCTHKSAVVIVFTTMFRGLSLKCFPRPEDQVGAHVAGGRLPALTRYLDRVRTAWSASSWSTAQTVLKGVHALWWPTTFQSGV